jgi:hypothetical protein
VKKTVIIIFLFQITLVSAQSELGSWNILNFNFKLSNKWNVFAESQLRSLGFYHDFHYYEYKIGGTFKLTNNFGLTSGIGSYNTFAEGGNFLKPMQNRETRTWFQFQVKTNIDRVIFENRFRMEQRFSTNGYRNRYRLRLGATIPLNSEKIQPKTISTILWNEIFFTNNEPYFERNRFFCGIGYEINKQIAFQTGYIYQFDYKINDETGRKFFNLALLYNIDLSKKPDYQPSNLD